MLEQALAVGLEQLCLVFGRPPAWDAMAPLYFEDLAHLGPDLVQLAVRRCRQQLKFFPRPAEIIELVAGELAERAEERERRHRERLMLAAPRRPEPTPEEIAYVEACAAECRQILAGSVRKVDFSDAGSAGIEPSRYWPADLHNPAPDAPLFDDERAAITARMDAGKASSADWRRWQHDLGLRLAETRP